MGSFFKAMPFESRSPVILISCQSGKISLDFKKLQIILGYQKTMRCPKSFPQPRGKFLYAVKLVVRINEMMLTLK
jgi:hypothetical protein